MQGIVPIVEALRLADEAGLDLVEISPNNEPPVCKILDFSRYTYKIKRHKTEIQKLQRKKNNVLKEIKFRINIADGDFLIKIKKIKSFLLEGNKVKISLWFKGREMMYKTRGFDLFMRITEEVKTVAQIESDTKMEGKQITMILAPVTQSKSISKKKNTSNDLETVEFNRDEL